MLTGVRVLDPAFNALSASCVMKLYRPEQCGGCARRDDDRRWGFVS